MKNMNNKAEKLVENINKESFIDSGWEIGDWCKFTDPTIKGLLTSRKTGKIIKYDEYTNTLDILCEGKIHRQFYTSEFGGISGVHPDDKDYHKTIKKSEVKKSKLPGCFDAQIWAKEFVEIVQNNSNIPYDEECMLGWFANAIMAGWDEYGSRISKQDLWVYVLRNWQNGEVISLYSNEPTKEKCDIDYSLHLGRDLEWDIPNVIYKSGQDSSWNCILERIKVDSLNSMREQIEIGKLKQYEDM